MKHDKTAVDIAKLNIHISEKLDRRTGSNSLKHMHGWETAGMPANQTFLKLSAGQSNGPEKNCVVLLPNKRRRPATKKSDFTYGQPLVSA